MGIELFVRRRESNYNFTVAWDMTVRDGARKEAPSF